MSGHNTAEWDALIAEIEGLRAGGRDLDAVIDRLRRAVEFYGPSKPGSADLAGVTDDEWIDRLVERVDG